MNYESFYSSLPIFLQNLACTLYGMREKRVRLGKDFNRHFASLIDSEFLPREVIDFRQDQLIANTIEYAYNFIPYYRELFKHYGLHPSDIRDKQSLRLIPVLSKEDVFVSSKSLLTTGPVFSPFRKQKTSGTTGTSLSFYTSQDSIAFTWAVWWRHRNRFGFRPGDWHINFTGRPVVPSKQKYPPHWRIDYARKQILVPGLHLTIDKVVPLAKFLDNKNCSFFTGYPSQIAQFFSLLGDSNYKFTNMPTHIFLGCENVQQFQRNLISQVSAAEITDQYGFSEGACNASRCEYGNYHEDWEYGHMDCLDPVSHPDGSFTGKIVATGFSNLIFPFIRYDVGDTATWAPESYRCPCGRESRVIYSIDGRNEDFVITPEGNKVMRFDYLFKDSTSIKEAQVVQREYGKILVRFVARDGFDPSELSRIRKMSAQWISERLVVDFEQVNSIEKSPSGKFRPVVSQLQSLNES